MAKPSETSLIKAWDMLEECYNAWENLIPLAQKDGEKDILDLAVEMENKIKHAIEDSWVSDDIEKLREEINYGDY